MDEKVGRNAPCPCGSGKKYKKCCLDLERGPSPSLSWMESDGMHFIAPGSELSPAELEQLTKAYQESIRNSPIWDSMVREFGLEQAEEMLKEFKAEQRQP